MACIGDRCPWGRTDSLPPYRRRRRCSPTPDRDNDCAVIGAPDEAVEHLREVAVNLNAGNLRLLLQSGNMDKQLTQCAAQRAAIAAYPPRLVAE